MCVCESMFFFFFFFFLFFSPCLENKDSMFPEIYLSLQKINFGEHLCSEKKAIKGQEKTMIEN